MNTQRWERISTLLECVLDLDVAERRELFARECVGDPKLGEEVELLVEADARSRGFLDAIPEARSLSRTLTRSLPAGARVGRYTLIRRLAAGGMGVVFEAQQERPNRRVALKLVQSALADESTLRRFRYEAEALGRLRHPGIAQVYEAGVDLDPGVEERPFLAMEFVEGARPVTQYVRETALPFDEIVRLFVEICAAVQHGHDHGVLHRDLKSSNVLVDSAGASKVIDFGIAMVLGDAHTRATHAGEIVGTLASMSPEQLDGGLDALDVRSDVYALGALLYESLCGRPPVDLKGLSLSDALVKVRSSVPARPVSVRPELPVELEWIVLRALEPDRERRYASAAELGRDLERYLGDEPLLASPPSSVYRVRKFVRRNRIVVGATVAVFVALIIGTVVALQQRDHAVLARDRAQYAEGLAKDRLARIEAEALTNRELAGFQREILTAADPDARGRDVRVVDVLAGAGASLDARNLDPKLDLVLRRSIVEAYSALGLPKDVERELAQMRPVWEATYAPDDAERLEFELLALGNEIESKPASECEQRARDGLARAIARHGPDSRELARWQLGLASVLLKRKQLPEAETFARSALARFVAADGPASSGTLDARLLVGRILNEMREYEQAESFKRDSYEACRTAHGEEHARTLQAKSQLAAAVGQSDRPEEAVRLLREVVAAHEQRTGRASSGSIAARRDLATFLLRAGQPLESLVEIESVLEDVRSIWGERHTWAYNSHVTRAATLIAMGRREEAVDELATTLTTAVDDVGADDAQAIQLQAQLGRALCMCGRLEEALPHVRGAWERARNVLGEDAATTIVFGNFYSVVLATMDRGREAVPVMEAVLYLQERRYGPDHQDTLVTLTNLTTVHRALGHIQLALCTAYELNARAQRNPALDLAARAKARWVLGITQRSTHDDVESLISFSMAAALWSASPEAGSEGAISALIDEGAGYGAFGRRSESIAVLERAVMLATAAQISPNDRARAFTALADQLNSAGEKARAKELSEMVVAGPPDVDPVLRSVAQGILDS